MALIEAMAFPAVATIVSMVESVPGGCEDGSWGRFGRSWLGWGRGGGGMLCLGGRRIVGWGRRGKPYAASNFF